LPGVTSGILEVTAMAESVEAYVRAAHSGPLHASNPPQEIGRAIHAARHAAQLIAAPWREDLCLAAAATLRAAGVASAKNTATAAGGAG
jgi:hypothetical protein